MSPDQLFRTLEANGEVFRHLLEPVGEEMATYRPYATSWNLLEIICHLTDEEIEDFRARTCLALDSGRGILKPIAPAHWVKARNYADRDFSDQLGSFLRERRKSVAWLHSLEAPTWDASFSHSELGVMTASEMLANWVAHDFHHIRQINVIKYEFLKEFTQEDLFYAGNWKP